MDLSYELNGNDYLLYILSEQKEKEFQAIFDSLFSILKEKVNFEVDRSTFDEYLSDFLKNEYFSNFSKEELLRCIEFEDSSTASSKTTKEEYDCGNL